MTTPNSYYFTSEAVFDGHPDKIADQISDCVLDTYLQYDPHSRVACETMVTKGTIVISGEILSSKIIHKSEINNNVRQCLKNIGCLEKDFHWNSVEIYNLLHEQSKELSVSIAEGRAGDQGVAVGYATNETPTFMPTSLYYAQTLVDKIRTDRINGIIPNILPDGKSLVTVQYKRNNQEIDQVCTIKNIVLSVQHAYNVPRKHIVGILDKYIKQTLPQHLLTPNTEYFINNAGTFIRGGAAADTGITGRKIITDTYGGKVPNGGGAFSGKDPSKIDRSASYMARYIAKNIVAAKLAQECTIYISYTINKAKPIAVTIDTTPYSYKLIQKLLQYIDENIDLSPPAIIDRLCLLKPFYIHTAWGGHFGRTPMDNGAFTWEKTDMIPNLITHCTT